MRRSFFRVKPAIQKFSQAQASTQGLSSPAKIGDSELGNKKAPCDLFDAQCQGKFTYISREEDKKRIMDDGKAITVQDEEVFWKNKLMFFHEFMKSPKHLTWSELGKEVECLECAIEPDFNRPEEVYHIEFHFKNQSTNQRECIFRASNDVSMSEGLSDLLAAIGTCLTRADVHRTVRFQTREGGFREINVHKTSRYTSDINIAFRPRGNKIKSPLSLKRTSKNAKIPLSYKEQMRYAIAKAYSLHLASAKCKQTSKSKLVVEKSRSRTPSEIAEESLSQWGFHHSLLDPENRDQDPPGTYHLSISTNAFACVVIKAIEKLIQKPLRTFYRPSQLSYAHTVETEESIGVLHAFYGWIGCEDKVYPHFTPLEAIQGNWFGKDAPFHVTALICKIRELAGLTKKNPETLSWMAVRYTDSYLALRNMTVKLSGAGPSRLFWPASYSPAINQMLPKSQQRMLRTKLSVAGILGFPDRVQSLPTQHENGKLSSPEAKASPQVK